MESSRLFGKDTKIKSTQITFFIQKKKFSEETSNNIKKKKRIKGRKISDIDGELHVVAKLEFKTTSKFLGVKRKKTTTKIIGIS